jgi:hypothetical protein
MISQQANAYPNENPYIPDRDVRPSRVYRVFVPVVINDAAKIVYRDKPAPPCIWSNVSESKIGQGQVVSMTFNVNALWNDVEAVEFRVFFNPTVIVLRSFFIHGLFVSEPVRWGPGYIKIDAEGTFNGLDLVFVGKEIGATHLECESKYCAFLGRSNGFGVNAVIYGTHIEVEK